ncbi:MAG: hypothetical protein IJI14_14830 [Anaerolineaceae bacterium]|nr:hypothetical protein [Anaerolineaceae bacterium]
MSVRKKISIDTIELGNLCFGNSRGTYSLNDVRDDMQEIWEGFIDQIDVDIYGYPGEHSPVSQDITQDRKTVDNDIFTIRPYYWGDDDAIAHLPNFVYKPENIEIKWYKYALRDAYCNTDLTVEKFDEILKRCTDFVKLPR